MIEWAIAGTLAWTYLKQKASEKLTSGAEDFASEQGKKIFSNLVSQLKEKIPAENNQLVRAHRRACLVAMQHICAQLNSSLGGDNLPSFIAKPKRLLLGTVPTSVVGQTEKDWLKKADVYLQEKIKEINDNLTYLPEQSSDRYQTIVAPSEISDVDRMEDFRLSLTEDALTEIILALEVEPPDRFIEAMHKYWFRLVCDEFQNSISNSPVLANIFQNKMLVEIALDTDTIKIQLDEFLKPLPDLIEQEGEKTRRTIVEETEKVLDAVSKNKPDQKLPLSLPTMQGFVGREDDLNELREFYQNGTRCLVLHGIGGVGKTATALRFAGEIADDYEGKIFVDMQGMGKNPLSWRDAMLEIVHQFEREIPTDISDAQLKSLFVQYVQSQPTLIVLDNAKNKQSVEALMQAKACFITTSRESFALTDRENKQIKKMSPDNARELLFKNGGGEKRFNSRADELASLAGYLPMALKPLAAILKEDELETVADLIEKYRDKKELLKEHVPDYENLTVEASFELSYEALPDEMKEYWRRLSVFPADFAKTAIEAVLDISKDEAREIQKQLRHFNLLEVNYESKRFRLHDLVRAFTDAKLSDEERFNTQFLHAKYFAFVLQLASHLKLNNRENGFVNALNLLDTEWINILAGQKWSADFTEISDNIAELCVNYSATIPELFALRLNILEIVRWQESSLKAAKILKNKRYESGHLGNLGSAYLNLGEYYKAITYYKQQLKISQEIADKYGEGSSLGNLGVVYNSLGQPQKAIEYYKLSLKIKRETNNKVEEGNVLCNLGNSYQILGEINKSIECYKQALVIFLELGDLYGESNSLNNLGTACQNAGQLCKAIEYFKQSLEIKTKIGDRKGQAISLDSLGCVFYKLKKYETAIQYHRDSLAIAQEINDIQGQGASLGNLGLAYFGLGDLTPAVKYQTQALEIFQAIGDRLGEACGLGNLGLAHFKLSEKKTGCDFSKKALAIYEEIGSPEANRIKQMIKENRC